jgi:hypothetical protein
MPRLPRAGERFQMTNMTAEWPDDAFDSSKNPKSSITTYEVGDRFRLVTDHNMTRHVAGDVMTIISVVTGIEARRYPFLLEGPTAGYGYPCNVAGAVTDGELVPLPRVAWSA